MLKKFHDKKKIFIISISEYDACIRQIFKIAFFWILIATLELVVNFENPPERTLMTSQIFFFISVL